MGGPLSLSPKAPLSPAERSAVMALLRRVLRLPGARLRHVVLFGSRARGHDGPASDLDLLLVFEELAPDREPHASWAEEAAAGVARRSGVPVEPWSVSLVDLERGRRTPMLVDALHDGIALWPAGEEHQRVPFTPPDALSCAASLIERVAEGSREVRSALRLGDEPGAALRARDDLVRLAIAWALLHGETRPRRGAAARRALALGLGRDPHLADHLRWAAGSYGSGGKDETALPAPPPGGLEALCGAVDRLRKAVERRAGELVRTAGGVPRGGTALAPARTRTRPTESR
jgi:predicted nucleotidyltransferase